MRKIAALIAVLLLGVSARAIELSLEENRGDRGSVGYVDMQRLFADSPDAQRAKESFEDLVRQAEERVNLRKAELLKLQQELASTRVERDALAASMILAAIPSTATARAAPSAVSVSTPAAAVAVSTAPAAPSAPPAPPKIAPVTIPPASSVPFAVAVSTPAPAHAAPGARSRELALPGMATAEVAPSAPPSAAPAPAPVSTRPVSPPPTAAVSPSTAPATVAVSTPAAPATAAAPAVSTAAAAAAASLFGAGPAAPVVQVPAGPTPAQRLLEFDAKIISVQADIAHKESELEHEHDDADRGLLDVESRKTDQVLARLYRAVSEIARREGVSVVIEKAAILYGQPAVDLTDKVLKYLKENPPQ